MRSEDESIPTTGLVANLKRQTYMFSLFTALLGCGFSVKAQYPNNYELLCAQGFVPASGPTGSTFNQSSGKYRAITCIDPNGNVTFQGLSTGGTGATGFTSLGTGTDSGIANAYIATVTFPAGMGATISGSQFTMNVNNSNTGASTINVNSAGAVSLVTSINTAFTGGELVAGNTYTFLYVGSNTWIVAGSLAGQPSLLSQQINAQMTGNYGINGTTSFSRGPVELYTPLLTSNLPVMRQMLTFHCVGNGATGCNSGKQPGTIGFDADGVFVFSAPGQIGFLSGFETFAENDFFGTGTASSVNVNVSDANHNLHTSGRIFGVTDKNARINFDIVATASGSLMKMDDSVAIGTQSISGCSLTSAVGGSWAGKFNSGTAGTCTVTITFPDTSTNGWVCDAHDTTTVADIINQTSFTTTTATISGTTASGDVITWKCQGF